MKIDLMEKIIITRSYSWISTYMSFTPEDFEAMAKEMRALGHLRYTTEGADEDYGISANMERLETEAEYQRRMKDLAQQAKRNAALLKRDKMTKEKRERKQYELLKKKFEK